MPTPLDNVLNSRSALFGFASIITVVAAWGIWSGDMFPAEKGLIGDPETWEELELRQWLTRRSLLPDENATREQLIERVKTSLRSV